MYDFILGGAASGKTAYIYERLTEDCLADSKKRFILFVPEQNTLRAQQMIAEKSQRGGMLNIDVLSFTLLTYRVFSELGVKKPDILDDMTKSLLLRKAMRLKKNELRLYSKKTDTQGFLDELKQAIAEFCQYDIDTKRLRELREQGVTRRLYDKLSDIAEIYDCFSSLLENGEIIPEELPKLILRLLPKSHFLDGAIVYFDGFTGFTPIQQKILAHVLSAASEVHFALTIPKEELGIGRSRDAFSDTDIFWLSRESMRDIGELSDRERVPHGKDVLLPGRTELPKTSCIIYEDAQEEVRELARSIKKQILYEHGGEIRYSDIAVAVSDSGTYRDLIKNEFEKAGIPFFMDEKPGSDQSQEAALLRACMDMICRGYRYEDVSRYIKNPLIKAACKGGVLYADIFDNYIRAKGIRGRKAYEASWGNTYRGAEGLDLDGLNAYREEVLSPVFRLHDRLREEKKLGGYAEALKAYISDAGIEDADRAFCEKLRGAGYANEAGAEESFSELCLLLLERISGLMGDEAASMKAFSELLSAGLLSLKTGAIPEGMDMLMVGDLKRSRFDGIRQLYIIGANEGLIPKSGEVAGIFTVKEREMLGSLGLSLAPQSARLTSSEYFYLYMLLHKPWERLTVTCPREGRDGKMLRPAEFISRPGTIKGIELKALRAEDLGSKEEEDVFYSSPEDALSSLASMLKEGDPGNDRLKRLYAFLSADERTKDRASKLTEGAFMRHEDCSIGSDTALELYGDSLYGSVTRIESFERCAYAHFLRYGLRLMERQRYDIEAADIGNLYHAAIEHTFRELADRKLEIASVSEAELLKIGENAVREVTGSYNDSILSSSSRNLYLRDRVSRITGRTLWALRSQAAKGSFRTAYCELPFRIKDQGLELHGRIDRVDLCEDRTDTYVKVIDYKSGKTRFDLDLVYHGLQLQLITYMDAAVGELEKRKGRGHVHPAGLYYYNIDDPVISYGDLSKKAGPEAEEAADKEILSELRMNGLSNSDPEILRELDGELQTEGDAASSVIPVKVKGGSVVPSSSMVCGTEGFRRLMERTRERIRKDTKEIFSGNIDIRPFRSGAASGCDYCPYRSVCGFDASVPGYGYRRLWPVSKDRLRAELFGEDGNDAVD